MANAPALNVLDLVEAYNEAKARLETADANAAALGAEITRLTPFEHRVTELVEALAALEEIADERGRAANEYAKERDAAVKRAVEADEKAKAATDELSAALAENLELDADNQRLNGDNFVLVEKVRALEAELSKARPVVEAVSGLRESLNQL